MFGTRLFSDSGAERSWESRTVAGGGRPPPPLPDRRLTSATLVSQCNATCGEGTRNRKVGCVGPGLTPVQADYCEPSSQPHARLSCKGPPCHQVWITGEWSEVGINGMRTDVWDSFGNILGVCSCVCVSVLRQLRYGLPAAHGLLPRDPLFPVSPSLLPPSQRALRRAPPPWHPALPPKGMPARVLLEGRPVE